MQHIQYLSKVLRVSSFSILLIISLTKSYGQYVGINGPLTFDAFANTQSWSGGVVPFCGSNVTITIPSGVTITINNTDIDLSTCAVTITIEDGGQLAIRNTGANTSSLILGAGSSVVIEDGGSLDSRTGGGGDAVDNTIVVDGSIGWDGSDGDINNGSGSDFVINSDPLPVELLHCSVSQNGHIAEIKWATAVEINNDYFTLYKSPDGINFEEFLVVPGSGDSNEKISYSAIDSHPYSGTSYYRIKQTDFDGASETFEIMSFVNESSHFILYPNPVTDKIIVNEIVSIYDTKILDMAGRDLTKNSQFTTQGNVTVIDVSDLEIGRYIIKSPAFTENFIKR
ncbi:T9SS type A sorting domain-containing protein [Ekhidna sp.]